MTRQMVGSLEKHITVRESLWGRWLPALFYALNIALWCLTAIVFEAWDLLYLALLTLPVLALYIWRTR